MGRYSGRAGHARNIIRRRLLPAVITSLLLVLLTASLASAHQPFFEDRDFTADAPGSVRDPTVSTALYATLATAQDVDYVTFEGKRGQSILIGITIPAIEGQENFTPTVALVGPGLPAATLPPQIAVRKATDSTWGARVWPAAPGQANVFFEPFSRTSYWERQEDRIALPADGTYTLAVWSDSGATGRYTLVVGDREVFGGDPAFGMKLPSYWTPVLPPVETGAAGTGAAGTGAKPAAADAGTAKKGEAHGHGARGHGSSGNECGGSPN
jgi:hypothetical protein